MRERAIKGSLTSIRTFKIQNRILDRLYLSAICLFLAGGSFGSPDAFAAATSGADSQSNAEALTLTEQKDVNRPIRDKWALIVGISNYSSKDIPRLRYASKDARDFRDYLVNEANFAPDHVRLLLDEQATQRRVLSELGTKFLARVAKPDDMVVLFFSTHGSPAQADIRGQNFIVASDSDPEDLYTTGIEMDKVVESIKSRVLSDRVLLVLDACHSGAVRTNSKGLFYKGNFDAEQLALGTGQLVICSSEPNQQSWESKRYENGIFTRKLLEALRANPGRSVLGESFSAIRESVMSEVQEDYATAQAPAVKGKWKGNELVLNIPPASPHPLPDTVKAILGPDSSPPTTPKAVIEPASTQSKPSPSYDTVKATTEPVSSQSKPNPTSDTTSPEVASTPKPLAPPATTKATVEPASTQSNPSPTSDTASATLQLANSQSKPITSPDTAKATAEPISTQSKPNPTSDIASATLQLADSQSKPITSPDTAKATAEPVSIQSKPNPTSDTATASVEPASTLSKPNSTSDTKTAQVEPDIPQSKTNSSTVTTTASDKVSTQTKQPEQTSGSPLLASVARTAFIPAPSEPTSTTLPTVPQTSQSSIKKGTAIDVTLKESIDSDRSEFGDRVLGTLTKPLMLNGQEVAKAGSEVKGKMNYCRHSGRFTNGRIIIVFGSIRKDDGKNLHIKAIAELEPINSLTEKKQLASSAARAGLGVGLYTGLRFIGVPGISTIGAIANMGRSTDRGERLKLEAGSTVQAILDKDFELPNK